MMSFNINGKVLTNALVFQVVWFVCVLDNNAYAALSVAILVGIHAALFHISSRDWAVILTFSIVGYLGDCLIATLLNFQYNNDLPFFGPLWLLGLWVAFSTTLNHSMKWIFNTPYHTLLIGLLLVPLSYLAGINLSNSDQLNTSISYETLYIYEGIWWAFILLTYQKFIYKQATDNE